ncbi:CIC11C00000001670 [Sungouiella intermedia]|uniref:CIC11C00000001670 n=1 Tax=Sungouiella intermedia TaxID=45354 RepID=A0A1L0BMP3_9ASCO|nr:CIC11C00000001670 [[Candida] intermedia]
MAVSTSAIAGIVSGRNPLEYSASSPYTIFLFQVVIIVFFAQLLHFPLKKIQQPRVIAEVLSGIILGPTVMGRIPNFTNTVFPTASKPGLTLVANVGIILFLFIVGLEVDLNYIKKNARAAFSVGIINMAIPFGLGCGIARGLYDHYRLTEVDLPPVKFTTYMVFIAVALCITAFPVLARILVELNLIGDKVGNVVLSAGIINDLTGWILLALVVTLANAGNGVNTVYILLLTLAWFLLLMYPVRMAITFYLRRFTNELTTGEPSQLLMLLILVLVFISSFYTDIIGVHPIFGAFMVGVILPRDNGFVIRITEKLEDLVYIVMIPVYFTLAGLGVNLGQLNTGIDWAYTIGIILLAMVGKIAGGFIAAKANGLFWRESLSVGVLMSCKGIVEIVVLNVGLNAHIISSRVYSMFVVMTLVTTFLTTPLTLWVYPVSYREKLAKYYASAENGEHELLTTNELTVDNLSNFSLSAIVLLLKKIDTIPQLMYLIRDLEIDSQDREIRAIHIREFTSRTSHLLEASSAGEKETRNNEQDFANSTSILAIVNAFSSMLNIKFSAKSILAPQRAFAATVNDQITSSSNFLLTSVSSFLLSPEESEVTMAAYKDLFTEVDAYVGVLVTSQPARTESFKAIHCVLNHDNFLSSTDLICLHLVRKLAVTHHNVHIHIRSAGNQNKEFESQFEEYIKSAGPNVDLEINYIRTLEEFIAESTAKDIQLENDMLVLPYDVVESQDELQLLRLGMRQLFDTLIVKANV